MAKSEIKKCRSCCVEKNKTEFVKDSSRKDGMFTYCKECHSEKRRKYVMENKEHVSSLKSESYFRNKFNKENIEKRKQKSKESFEKIKQDPELYQEHLDRFKDWSKTQRGKLSSVKRKQKRRESIKETDDGSITIDSLMELEYKQMNVCGICSRPLDELLSGEKHLDHIKPLSKGGEHKIDNVQWTCSTCNLSKNNSETKTKLDKKLWTVFSKYIRLKHSDIFGNCTCYTCGAVNDIKKTHAGHYVSRQYKSVKFDERNVRPQCYRCNMFFQGQPLDFRDNLVKELGEETVQEIEKLRHKIFKVSDEWYIERIEYYKQKVKELE